MQKSEKISEKLDDTNEKITYLVSEITNSTKAICDMTHRIAESLERQNKVIEKQCDTMDRISQKTDILIDEIRGISRIINPKKKNKLFSFNKKLVFSLVVIILVGLRIL